MSFDPSCRLLALRSKIALRQSGDIMAPDLYDRAARRQGVN
jgi:hypothetical protein